MDKVKLVEDGALEFYRQNGYWLHQAPLFRAENSAA